MTKRLPKLLAVALAILALLVSGIAFAGPATIEVKAKQAVLFSLLQQPTPDAQKIRATFDELLDYPVLTEGSLGSEWAGRTAAEKAEFSELLKALVRQAYERDLKKILTYDVDYVGEDADGNAVVVKTRAKSKTDAREEPLELSLKVAQSAGKWKVQDIVTEGVSMVTNFRSQFTKVIKNEGFPALVRKMKEKLAKGG